MKNLSEMSLKLNQLNVEPKIIDCSLWEINKNRYGGAAGRKFGVTSPDGVNYMLKYATSFKGRNLKNVEVSYGNNPVSEFIGSHVYSLVNVPVHNTKLAWYKGKLVVLCGDFVGRDEELIEFNKIRNYGACENEDFYDATSLDIWEVLYTIQNTVDLNSVRNDLLQQLLDAFVIDYINGNPDRNLGNFGIIRNRITDNIRVAPIYDNGNCLSFRYSKEQIKECLENTDIFKNKLSAVASRFTEKDHSINPLKFMNTQFGLFKESIEKVLNANILDKLPDVFKSIEELEDSALYTEFYTKIYEYRLEQLKELYNTKSNG